MSITLSVSRVFMSLMTVISGASSLLLLLIPPKLVATGLSSRLTVTCCDPGTCHDVNNTLYGIVPYPSDNDTMATCNFHDDFSFGLVQGMLCCCYCIKVVSRQYCYRACYQCL